MECHKQDTNGVFGNPLSMNYIFNLLRFSHIGIILPELLLVTQQTLSACVQSENPPVGAFMRNF